MGMQVVKGVRYSDADVEALGLKGGRRVVNGDKVTATTHRAIGVHVPQTTTNVLSTDTKAEDAKAEDAKAEDAKAEDAKAEDAKAEDAKAEDTKAPAKKAR